MVRLLFFLFLLLSVPVFSQDTIINTDTAVHSQSIVHELGSEKFPSPQETLKATLLKDQLSVTVNTSRLIWSVVALLVLVILVTAIVIRRKRLKKRG
jgi:hypothetical protein